MKKIFAVAGITLLLMSIMLLFPAISTTVHAAPSVSHMKYTITYGKTIFVKGSSRAVTYGCKGLSCDGQDPANTNCNQSSLTIKSFTVTDSHGTVAQGNNVYSIGCNANWTEATSMASRANGVWLTGKAVDSTGKDYHVCFPGNDGYYGCGTSTYYTGATGWPAYTDMIDGTHKYTACINTASGRYNCQDQ